jgi:hypothetical protein
MTPDQLDTDFDFITSQEPWKTGTLDSRTGMAREIAAKAYAAGADPIYHRELTRRLYENADPRSTAGAAVDWVKEAGKSVLESAIAMGPAVAAAASDAVGLTDTGSGTRLAEGAKTLLDQTGQRLKQLDPNDLQETRDDILGSLREAIDNNEIPEPVQDYLAGRGPAPEDEEGQQWLDALTNGLGRAAIQADKGTATAEDLAAWRMSDRNPVQNGYAANDSLLDYLVTRDPDSWDAFSHSVTETEQQYQQRRMTALTSPPKANAEELAKADPVTRLSVYFTERGLDMQESPIDMVSSLAPFLRGAKLFSAAKAGRAVQGGLVAGMASEAIQEGTTELLSDSRNTAAQVAEAAAMGAVGTGILEGTAAAAGSLFKPSGVDAETITSEDLGELTAEDVADLELPVATIATEEEPIVDTSPRQPILTNVPDQLPPAGNPLPAPSNRATAATPAPTSDVQPPAPQVAGTPNAENEQPPPAADPPSITNIGTKASTAVNNTQRRPVIPDSPLGGRDLLDFLNGTNPIGAPSELELNNEDWQERTQIPKKLRRFVTDPTGQAPEQVAQAAHDAGLISAPTADALIAAINETYTARENARADAKKQEQITKDAERQTVAFEKAQTRLSKAKAPLRSFDQMRQGDSLTMDGDTVTVSAVEYNEDGQTTTVVVDSPTHGRQTFDASARPGLYATDYQPSPTRASNQWADRVLRDSEKTPFVGLDPRLALAYTIKGAELIAEGYTTFAKWAGEMIRRFSEKVRPYLKDVWKAAKKTSRQGAININATNAPLLPSDKTIKPPLASGLPRETRSRMRRPDPADRVYITKPDVVTAAAATAFLDAMPSLSSAVAALEEGVEGGHGLRSDEYQQAIGQAIERATDLRETGNEAQRAQARDLMHRASKLWQSDPSQQAGRTLRQRMIVNHQLFRIKPILAAETALVDRADTVINKRFTGGTEAGANTVNNVAEEAGQQAGESLADALDEETNPPAPASTTEDLQRIADLEAQVKEANQNLTRQKNLFGQAQDSWAAIVETLKGAGVYRSEVLKNVKGRLTQRKSALLAEIRASNRYGAGGLDLRFVEYGAVLIAEGVVTSADFTQAMIRAAGAGVSPYLEEIWTKASEIVRKEYEAETAKVKQTKRPKKPAKVKARSPQGKADRFVESLLKQGPPAQGVKDAIKRAYLDQVKNPVTSDLFANKLSSLGVNAETAAKLHSMAALDTASRARVAGEAASLKNQQAADAMIQRLNFVGPQQQQQASALQQAYKLQVQNPQGLADFTTTLAALGINAASAQQLHSAAAAATQDQINAKTRAQELAAQRVKENLLAGGKPLAQMLNKLRSKMLPGVKWKDIFTALPSQQKARQRQIYERLMKDERLQGLTPDERRQLTNELDRAWQSERREIFKAELRKEGVLPSKSPKDKDKVVEVAPKLLRWVNLGVMNAAAFREAVAPKYGLRQMTDAQAAELRRLAEEAYNLPEGVLRGRKLAEMLSKMQSATGLSRAELLQSYWTASVLSGLRTQFAIAFGAINGFADNLIGASALLVQGNRRDAVAAHLRWWQAFGEGLADSWQIIGKGDYSVLKRFNEDLEGALQGTSKWRPVPLGEALWRNGSAWTKAPAAVMLFTGRIMAALDHVTNTATTEGAKIIARANHPELYAQGAWSKEEKQNARKLALMEVTGGAEPTNAADAATVRIRTRENLNGLMQEETVKEASFIGDQAALQNDPVGLLGAIHESFKGMLGILENFAHKGADQSNPMFRAFLKLAASFVRPVTGTTFLRAGANVGNQFLSYMPGTFIASYAIRKQMNNPLSKSQNQILAGRNILGFMAAAAVGSMFVGKGEEEEGWHGEGNWSNIPKELQSLLRARGLEPGTFWKIENGKIRKIYYRDFPMAGIFTAVLGAQDLYRADPEAYKQRGLAHHLLHGYASGIMQVKDAAAIGTLTEALQMSPYSSNPEEDLMKSLAKLPINVAGGMVPTILKDAEVWTDPRLYRPDGVMEELVKQTGFGRTSVNGGYPAVSRLGDDIQLNRQPWSRLTSSAEASVASSRLGQLLAKGLQLPGVSLQKQVLIDGQRHTLETLGPKAEYLYHKAVGQQWKEYLASPDGAELLTVPLNTAEKRLSHKDEVFKIRAIAKIKPALKPTK